MTEEEKEREEVVDLSRESTSTTTKTPTIAETKKNDETTTTTEQTLSPWMNADGTVNTQMQEFYDDKFKNPLANAYGIDPETGNYVGSIADLLGFDPEIRKRELEKKKELADFKRKEAGWKNALGVIADVVTSAAGGNVWARTPDDVGKQSKTEADEAQNAIRQIGDAIPAAKRAREQQYRQEAQKQLAEFVKNYSQKVSVKKTEGGGGTTTTTGGTTTTTTSGTSQRLPSGSSGGKVTIGGKTYNKKTQVRMPKKGGGYITFDADTERAVSYARFAIARGSEWLRNNKDKKETAEYKRIYSALRSAGVVDPLRFDPNKQTISPDEYIKFVQNGRLITIDDVQSELAKLYNEATGKKIRFTSNTSDDAPWTTGNKETSGEDENTAPWAR